MAFMKECDFESILERYPELIEEGMILEGRQVALGRKHIDLLFRDKFGQKLIVELKRGTILRKHISQIFDYEGDILFPDDPNVRVMLIGNRVPPNFRRSLEHHGFEWREFTFNHLIRFLKKKGDTEFLKFFDETQKTTVSPLPEPPAHVKVHSNKTSMKIRDKMDALFAADNIDQTFDRKQIIDMVLAAFPGTNESSVIPSDYCYNIVNKGIKFDHHLFEYLDDSMYRVLGKNFPFVGAIFWKGKKVGEWRKGSSEPIFFEKVAK